MADTKVGTKTGKSTQAGRDVYKTEDGENVSEKSVTFKYKGQWINVPSIHEGYQYDDDTLRMMLDSEVIKPTSTHKSESDAVKAAIKRSKSLKFNEGGDVAAQTEAAFNTRRQDRRQAQRNAQQNAREVNADLESKENTDTPSHPLGTVPFFSRPMGSSTDDRQVGIDDGGNPVFQGRFGNYTVQRADDQRTFRSKVEQDVLPAVKEYLNNPTAPTAEQTVNFAKQIAGDAWETISIPGDLLSGEKSGADVTLGEIFEMVPAMAAASTAFKVPGGEDTLRIFGGPGAKSYYNRDFYKAQDLLTKGQTPEQVEAATGRFDSARTGDYIGSPISLDKDYQDIKDKKDYLEGQLAREDLSPDLRQEYESAQTTLNLELADIEAKYPSGVSEPENPLKFEIDDSQVEIRSNDGSQTLKESTKQYPIAVGNIIPTHTELFKEYPDLADVNFYVDPSSSSTSAFFNPLVGNNGAIVVGSSRAASNPNSNFFRNGFFHELQHAAQYQDYKVEGLSQLGGSPTSIGQNLVRGKIPVQKTLEKNKKLVSVRDELLDLFDKSSDVRDPKVAKDLARKMREMESELFKTYMRSASEVEARVVGKRGEVLGDRAENSVSSQIPLERQIETLSEFQEDMPKSPSGKIKEDIKIKLGPMTEEEIKRYSEGAINFARYAKGVDDKLQGFGDFADPKRRAANSQSNLDANTMSAFGADAARLKPSDPTFSKLTEDATTDAVKELNLTEEKLLDWKNKNYGKDKFRVPPDDQMASAATELREGKISSEQFRKLSSERQPIKPITEMPKFPTKEDVVQALAATDPRKTKKGVIGVNKTIEDGTPISSRLDIPAYNNTDTWVVSLHDGTVDQGKSVGYAQTAVLDDVRFTSNPLAASKIATGSAKSTIARMQGKWKNADPEAVYDMASTLFDDPEWSQVGMNPYRASYFYDKADGMPVVSADQVVQVGPLVFAKKVIKTTPDDPRFEFENKRTGVKANFNEGGAVVDRQAAVNNQMEMAFGDEVEQIDAVSGNEVPPGSTPKEVRDDIPVMLSEGEYVIPADVTRYYGVKFFEDLRNQAKIDLAAMEQNGRIGGEPIPEDDELTDDEMAILQEVMMSEQETAGMFQGGMATPTQIPSVSQVTQPTEMTLKSQLKLPTYSRGMAEGGDSKKLDPFGNPIRQVPSDPADTMPSLLADTTDNSSSGIYGIETSEDNAATTGRYRYTRTTSSDTTGVGSGMKTVFYIHKDGRRLPVLTLNGKPIGSVPPDFAEFLADTPENRTKLNFGSSEEEEEETTEGTANTTGTNEGEGEGSNYGVDDIQTSPDINTPDGVEASYSGTGVSVSDPVGAAKDALGSTVGAPKGLGAVATAISPGFGALAAGVGVTSSLSAVSTANANKSMAEFLGKTDEAKEIQDSIDDFLSKSPKAISSLDSIVASGDSKFSEALEAAFDINAPEDAVIYSDELTSQGKINVDEYLSKNAPKAPTSSDRPVTRNDVTPTTPSSTTPTTTSSTPTGLYSGITGKSFSDTALGGFLGLGDKDNDNENDNDAGETSGEASGGTSGGTSGFGGGER